MRNVTSWKSACALFLRGYKHALIRNVRVIDCRFENAAKPDVLENVEGLIFPGRDDTVKSRGSI